LTEVKICTFFLTKLQVTARFWQQISSFMASKLEKILLLTLAFARSTATVKFDFPIKKAEKCQSWVMSSQLI
jgi:hypothetical protein